MNYNDYEDTSAQEQRFLEKFRSRERRDSRDSRPSSFVRTRELKNKDREERANSSIRTVQS